MAKFPRDVARLLDSLTNDDIETVKKGKKMELGNMFLWVYDPKHKATLPYYDILPLTIVLRFHPPYVSGVNIHFIFPWTQRVKLVGEIMKAKGNGRRLKYKDIVRAWKKAKLPKALFYYSYRKYLISHIRTNIKVFDEDNWRPAVVNILPKFRKEQDAAIARDILNKYKEDKKSGKIG